MSLFLIVAVPFLGALLPGLMNAVGRQACAGVTFIVSLVAFIGLLTNLPAVIAGDVVQARVDWLPLLGLLYLLAFVLLRATSLHQMDALINLAPAGVRLNWLLEWLGIGLVAIPAGQFLRKAG